MNAAPIGITTRNTIVVPCIVKSWLYRSALSNLPFGVASCSRIKRASQPPITKKNSADAPYMMPIFLWSTVVTQLRHPVLVCGRSKTPSVRRGPPPSPEGRAGSVASGVVMLIAAPFGARTHRPARIHIGADEPSPLQGEKRKTNRAHDVVVLRTHSRETLQSSAPSLQGLKVGDQLVDLQFGQVQVRHSSALGTHNLAGRH